jgi:ribose 5-phosphate isomerase B
MKIYIAADHAGYELKTTLIPFLESEGHEVEDCGAFVLDPEDDYPDFVMACARNVASDVGSRGIVIGASGEGEAIAANRIRGARTALFYAKPSRTQTDMDGKKLSIIASAREHNDANILSLGARFLTLPEVKEALDIFLNTPFSHAPRHVRRIEKFDTL